MKISSVSLRRIVKTPHDPALNMKVWHITVKPLHVFSFMFYLLINESWQFELHNNNWQTKHKDHMEHVSIHKKGVAYSTP